MAKKEADGDEKLVSFLPGLIFVIPISIECRHLSVNLFDRYEFVVQFKKFV